MCPIYRCRYHTDEVEVSPLGVLQSAAPAGWERVKDYQGVQLWLHHKQARENHGPTALIGPHR